MLFRCMRIVKLDLKVRHSIWRHSSEKRHAGILAKLSIFRLYLSFYFQSFSFVKNLFKSNSVDEGTSEFNLGSGRYLKVHLILN